MHLKQCVSETETVHMHVPAITYFTYVSRLLAANIDVTDTIHMHVRIIIWFHIYQHRAEHLEICRTISKHLNLLQFRNHHHLSTKHRKPAQYKQCSTWGIAKSWYVPQGGQLQSNA